MTTASASAPTLLHTWQIELRFETDGGETSLAVAGRVGFLETSCLQRRGLGVHHPGMDRALNGTHRTRYPPCAIKVTTARCSLKWDQVGLFEARGVLDGLKVLIGR
jgi:hypothetical protein